MGDRTAKAKTVKGRGRGRGQTGGGQVGEKLPRAARVKDVVAATTVGNDEHRWAWA